MELLRFLCLTLVLVADAAELVCRMEYLRFLGLVDSYWKGKPVSDPHLAMVAGDMLTFMGRWCPPAQAAAHVLVAELCVWLSRPLAGEVPAGPQRAEYDAEVWRYARSHTRRAAALVATDSDITLVGDGKLGLLLDAFNATWPDLPGVLHVSTQVSPHEAILAASGQGGATTRQEWSPFAMAVLDQHWGEVWLPALLKEESALWPFLVSAGVHPEFTPLLDEPVAELVPRLERALQTLLFLTLDKLSVRLKRGVIAAFWPCSSTLIALLRYGRLFGAVSGGRTDCVDDDLDFAVWLPAETPGAWPRFVRDIATAIEALGCSCHVGGAAKRLQQLRGRYDRLLCICYVMEFILPVSFERHGGEGLELPPLGLCDAYGREVPCPLDARPHLAKYGGCVALPDVRQSALTIGNECVQWMQGGLQNAHIAEIREAGRQLADRGFVSMEAFWGDAECEATSQQLATAAATA